MPCIQSSNFFSSRLCQLVFCTSALLARVTNAICYIQLGAEYCTGLDGNRTPSHISLPRVDEETCALHCTGDRLCGGYTFTNAGRCSIDPECRGLNCHILSSSGLRPSNATFQAKGLKRYKCLHKMTSASECSTTRWPSLNSGTDSLDHLHEHTTTHSYAQPLASSQLLRTSLTEQGSLPHFVTMASSASRQEPWDLLVWQLHHAAIFMAALLFALLLPVAA